MYRLVNNTRNQGVSSYWKGAPPQTHEVLLFAHVLGWKPNDLIISAYYCDILVFEQVNGEWTFVEKSRSEIERLVQKSKEVEIVDTSTIRPYLHMDHFPEFDQNEHCVICDKLK